MLNIKRWPNFVRNWQSHSGISLPCLPPMSRCWALQLWKKKSIKSNKCLKIKQKNLNLKKIYSITCAACHWQSHREWFGCSWRVSSCVGHWSWSFQSRRVCHRGRLWFETNQQSQGNWSRMEVFIYFCLHSRLGNGDKQLQMFLEFHNQHCELGWKIIFPSTNYLHLLQRDIYNALLQNQTTAVLD